MDWGPPLLAGCRPEAASAPHWWGFPEGQITAHGESLQRASASKMEVRILCSQFTKWNHYCHMSLVPPTLKISGWCGRELQWRWAGITGAILESVHTDGICSVKFWFHQSCSFFWVVVSTLTQLRDSHRVFLQARRGRTSSMEAWLTPAPLGLDQLCVYQKHVISGYTDWSLSFIDRINVFLT